MSTAKIITGIVPGLMATSLVAANLREIDFDLKPKKGKKKKNYTKKMVKMRVTNLMAIPLIGATGGMVNKLS